MRQITKNRILVFGFVLLLLAIYRVTLVKTINLSGQVANLEHSVRNTSELVQSNLLLEVQLQYNDSILNANNLQNSSIQNRLLRELNKLAIETGISITKFLEPHESFSNNGRTLSYQFRLQGDYNALEHGLFKMETSHRLSKIEHVKFEKKSNYQKGNYYLECEVIIELIDSEK